MAERELDVIVLGATGVTGRRVAEYLGERAPETGARWAAAGRDATRLERVLGEEGVSAPETIVADVSDPASLEAMASRTRVVLNLVGPYTPTARPVIDACVAAGAHYADLSGEIPFVRRIVDDFDARASDAGVKIVQVCGFESVPADLAVVLATEAARERWGEALTEADLHLWLTGPPGMPRPSDSGGVASAQSLVEMVGDEDSSTMTDPAALITDGATAAEVRRRSPISVRPRSADGGAVVAPMFPSPFITPAVIHRTTALLAAERGARPEIVRYREGLVIRGGTASTPLRYAAAGALSGTHAALARVAGAQTRVRRRFSSALRAVLPSSGSSPPVDRQAGWRWGMSLETRTAAGKEVRVEVDSEGHIGYLATGRILGEAGLLLAEPGATPERAGCLTPATALGTDNVERFVRARLRFTVA